MGRPLKAGAELGAAQPTEQCDKMLEHSSRLASLELAAHAVRVRDRCTDACQGAPWSARQSGMQPYVQAAVHCCLCKVADPYDFPEAGHIVVRQTHADGLTACCHPCCRHCRIWVTTILDEEGILHGWSRHGHGRKHLSRSTNPCEKNLSDEVWLNTMIVEQVGASCAGVQEGLSALPNGTPLLVLSRKCWSSRQLLPSVKADRASVRDEATDASSGSALDARKMRRIVALHRTSRTSTVILRISPGCQAVRATWAIRESDLTLFMLKVVVPVAKSYNLLSRLAPRLKLVIVTSGRAKNAGCEHVMARTTPTRP